MLLIKAPLLYDKPGCCQELPISAIADGRPACVFTLRNYYPVPESLLTFKTIPAVCFRFSKANPAAMVDRFFVRTILSRISELETLSATTTKNE